MALAILLVSCGEERKRVEVNPGADSVEVVSTKDGSKIWAMKAFKVLEKGDTLIGYGIRITFFSGNSPSSILIADSGKYEQSTERMVALGKVYMKSNEDTELWTKSLNWDPKKKLIWTDDSVKVRQKDRTVRAKGLETDAEISYVKFKSKVFGEGERLE